MLSIWSKSSPRTRERRHKSAGFLVLRMHDIPMLLPEHHLNRVSMKSYILDHRLTFVTEVDRKVDRTTAGCDGVPCSSHILDPSAANNRRAKRRNPNEEKR